MPLNGSKSCWHSDLLIHFYFHPQTWIWKIAYLCFNKQHKKTYNTKTITTVNDSTFSTTLTLQLNTKITHI